MTHQPRSARWSVDASRRMPARAPRFRGDPVKRLIDIVGAAFLLVLLAPLVVLLSVFVKMDSPGPAFYRARRTGFQGREFEMLKYRKMPGGVAGAPLSVADDERFTIIGRFLAHTKLDEIPQLFNVLMGQMSLVGPRPEDPLFVARAGSAYETILTVKPGMTGLSQLAFAREGSIPVSGDRVEHYLARLLPQKMAMDALYAKRRTTAMDLRILWWTLLSVCFNVEVAVYRDTATLRRRSPRANQAPAPAADTTGANGRKQTLASAPTARPQPRTYE